MKKYWKSVAATCLAATMMTAPLATTAPVDATAATQKASTVSLMAKIKSEKAAIYKNAGDQKALTTAGTAYTNEIFYVRQKLVVSGTTYYQITRGAKDTVAAIGWVKASDLKTASFSYPKNEATALTLNGTGTGYTRPGGLSRNMIVKSLAAQKGKTFTPLSTAKVGNDTWYFGQVDGISMWIQAASVEKIDTPAEAVSYVASAKSAKTPIYAAPGDKKALMKAGTAYTNEIFYVYAKKMVGDVAYYEIKRKKEDAAIGWVKETSLKLQPFKYVTNSKKTFYVKGKSKGYSRPAGKARNVIYSTLAPYKDDVFKSTSKAKVGTATWYIGKIGGNSVWVKAAALTTTAPTADRPVEEKPVTPEKPETVVIVEEPTSLIASISNKKAQLITDLKAYDETTQVASAQLNKAAVVKKQATIKDTLYYYFEGIGWAEAADTKEQTLTDEKDVEAVRTLKGTGRGYNVPGASKAGEAVLSTLAALANTDFTVTASAKVSGKLWYYGTTVNDVAMWTAASNTTAKKAEVPEGPTYSAENFEATLKSGTITVYKDVEAQQDARNLTADEKVQLYTVTKKAITVDGDAYYLLTQNGETIGWVEANTVTAYTPSTKTASLFFIGLGKAYSEAGAKGAVIYSSLDKYRTQGFVTVASKTVNSVTYYQGLLDGKIVWVASTDLANPFYVENLRKVSNVTAAEMEAYLIKKKGTAIKTNPLYQAIPAFLAMQEKYGINAQFMLAHSIVETGWGGSEIFKYKNNGFGYQAYDSCAKTCAYYFPTMNDSVGYYAYAIYNKYLKPGATYNNGETPAGMNVRYASDKTWGQSIARIMNEMKAYDADYYAKQTPSTIEPAPITETYDHIIPADKPQPATFHQIKGTATVNAATKIYTLPYAVDARYITTAKVGDKLNIVAYHEDVKDPSATSRWFRIDYKGQQAWVQSATLSIPNLVATTKNNTIVLTEPGTLTAMTAAVYNDKEHLTVVLDTSGKWVTKKGADNETYISVQLIDSTKIGWVKQSDIRSFE
jgi:mannosyl-glycoprotein endo-beta-N-acetylglucosaminidase